MPQKVSDAKGTQNTTESKLRDWPVTWKWDIFLLNFLNPLPPLSWGPCAFSYTGKTAKEWPPLFHTLTLHTQSTISQPNIPSLAPHHHSPNACLMHLYWTPQPLLLTCKIQVQDKIDTSLQTWIKLSLCIATAQRVVHFFFAQSKSTIQRQQHNMSERIHVPRCAITILTLEMRLYKLLAKSMVVFFMELCIFWRRLYFGKELI